MRIAMFTNNYLPRVSGPAHAIDVLQKQLRALGNNIVIFAPQYTNYTNNTDNIVRVAAITFPHRIFYPIPVPYFSNIEEQFKKHNFDIIHSHHPIMLGQLAMDFSKKYNIPIIYSYHSQWHSYLYRFFNFFPFERAAKIFGSLCNEYALNSDAVIVPNKIFTDIFLKIGHRNVAAIPSPINDRLFRSKIVNAKQKLRLRLKLPLKSKVILNVSRISFEKNVDFLIESVSLIKRKNIFLVIAGDGMAVGKIKNLIRALNLDSRVLLLGQIAHGDLPFYYQGCDIFAQVSDFETQCLALNEAMASGCVIVAKKADYLEGVIQDGKNGYVSQDNVNNYAEVLNAALYEGKKNILLSKQAKKSSKEYSAAFIAAKIEKLYKKIIDKC